MKGKESETKGHEGGKKKLDELLKRIQGEDDLRKDSTVVIFEHHLDELAKLDSIIY